MLTFREAKYVRERVKGVSKYQALIKLGFAHYSAENPRFIESPEVLAEIERLQAELVDNTLHTGLVDAIEVHETLSEMFRADIRDIRNDDGSFKPQSAWPPIWGQMIEGGDCEIEYEDINERSHDDETHDKAGGWDTVGQRKVKKVKIKSMSRSKIAELLMRHKGVNALAAEKLDVNVTVQAEIKSKLQSALDRARKVESIEPKQLPESGE